MRGQQAIAIENNRDANPDALWQLPEWPSVLLAIMVHPPLTSWMITSHHWRRLAAAAMVARAASTGSDLSPKPGLGNPSASMVQSEGGQTAQGGSRWCQSHENFPKNQEAPNLRLTGACWSPSTCPFPKGVTLDKPLEVTGTVAMKWLDLWQSNIAIRTNAPCISGRFTYRGWWFSVATLEFRWWPLLTLVHHHSPVLAILMTSTSAILNH